MKILLIAPFPPPYGGIANWSQLMLDYVKKTSDEFYTLNIAPKKRSTEGRNLFDRVVVSGLDMLRKQKELKAKIKEHKPDVIHMTTSGSLAIIRDIALFKIAKKFGVSTVYHIRFGKAAEMAEKNSLSWKLFLKAMRLADAVIAIDEKTYETLKQNLTETQVCLLPNPIAADKLPKTKNIKKQVVFLGWVIPTKGITELVEAWNTVGNEFGDYSLKIIGQYEQSYYDKLQSDIKVKNIEFVGEMSHDDALLSLAESEIFVLPSYTEGFPNAVVEAMALGKAVVASDVGAIPQMLSDGCGEVIKSKSADEIVTALRKVISNSEYRETISKNALNRVYERYTIEKVYELYKDIWLRVKNK